MARKYELTKDEMLEILRARVWKIHNMDLDAYISARKAGTLKRVLADAELEVFASGPRGNRLGSAGEERVPGQTALSQHSS